VVAHLAAVADPGVVEAGAQVGVAGIGVGQQMPDDDQDRAADRDDGFVLAAAAGDPPAALAEEGIGAGGADRDFAQDPGQAGVAVAGGVLTFLLPGRLADPGGVPGPGGQVTGVGNRLISRPVSARRTAAATGPMPWTSSRRAAAAAKGAIISSILVSSSAMPASIASTRFSVLASKKAW
jgi:hypothetical protein